MKFKIALSILLLSVCAWGNVRTAGRRGATEIIAKTVINPAVDFTPLGAFALPDGYMEGLTGRYVGGVYKLYTLQFAGDYRGHMFEFSPVADGSLKTEPNYTSASLQSFGDIFQNAIASYNSGSLLRGLANVWDTYWGTAGLYWDETDQRMYWLRQKDYESMDFPDVTIGYSTINDGNHTGTGTRIWSIASDRFPDGPGNRWAFGMTAIPTLFSNNYLGGRRLGVGMGGGMSIIGNGTPSIGPALFAIAPPNLDNDTDLSTLSGGYVELLNHPEDASYAKLRATRNASYPGFNDFEGGNYDHATTYWFRTDQSRYGVWIDTATKHGVIFPSYMGAGNANTTVLASPAPTKSVFTVASIGDIQAGDLIKIGTDYNPTPIRPFEHGKVLSVSGGEITLVSDLTGTPIEGGAVVAGSWYGSGGEGVTRYWTPWYVYDPADLALVAANPITYPADRVVPKYNTNVALPGVSYPLPGSDAINQNPKYMILGCAFDAITNRLYLLITNPGARDYSLIYVFQLS